MGAGHKITAVCRVEVSGVQTLRRGEGATPGAQERLWKEVTRGPRPLSTLIPALSCAPKTNKQASKATKVSLSLKMQVWTLSGDLKTGWRHMPRVAPPPSLSSAPNSQHPANSGSSSEPSRHWMMPSQTMDWKRHCWRFLHTKSMKRVHRGSERDQRGEGVVSRWSWGPHGPRQNTL